jgi:hypothetical protein
VTRSTHLRRDMLCSSDACWQLLPTTFLRRHTHCEHTAGWHVSEVCARTITAASKAVMLVSGRLVSQNGPECGLALDVCRAAKVRSKNNRQSQHHRQRGVIDNKADSIQVGQTVRCRRRSRAKLVHSSPRTQSFCFDFLIRRPTTIGRATSDDHCSNGQRFAQ